MDRMLVLFEIMCQIFEEIKLFTQHLTREHLNQWRENAKKLNRNPLWCFWYTAENKTVKCRLCN